MSPFNVNDAYDMYTLDGTHIGNPDTKNFNIENTLSAGGFSINRSRSYPPLSYIKFTNTGIYCYDINNKFICVI